MFSGVLRFTLSRRSVIIVSMMVRLMSPLYCFSSFDLVFVLVLLLGVRMLIILFSLFSFCLCLSLGCGVVIPSIWFPSLFSGLVLPFCVFVVLNFVIFVVVLSFGSLFSSCVCERSPLLCLGYKL